jgi:hypothetical protein
MDKAFSFSKLGHNAERRILTRWLQNALEMPIPLSNNEVQSFCKKYKCTVQQLVDAADTLDINVAIVDDLIKLHMLQGNRKKAS